MTERITPKEPDPYGRPKRVFPDENYVPLSDNLAETREKRRLIDRRIFDAIAPLLDQRLALTNDAVRFKESLEQVEAVEQQTVQLVEVQQWAEEGGHPSARIIVDVFDAIALSSVESQKELFSQTRLI